jgi:hypothetical protein
VSTREIEKKEGFERKYAMSILGNIYILILRCRTCAELLTSAGLTCSYKAIYWMLPGRWNAAQRGRNMLFGPLVTV